MTDPQDPNGRIQSKSTFPARRPFTGNRRLLCPDENCRNTRLDAREELENHGKFAHSSNPPSDVDPPQTTMTLSEGEEDVQTMEVGEREEEGVYRMMFRMSHDFFERNPERK